MQPALIFKMIRWSHVRFEFNIPDIDQFFVLLFRDAWFDGGMWSLSYVKLLYWPLHRYVPILVKQECCLWTISCCT